MLIIVQQDATIYGLYIYVNCSACFAWYLHPSSGAHITLSTVSGSNETVTATCRERDWTTGSSNGLINPLTPNDLYISRTAPLTSKRCILYIYSTNIGTEYFEHALYSPFFSLQNAVCFIMLTCLVPVLFTFYIQGVLKLKKK